MGLRVTRRTSDEILPAVQSVHSGRANRSTVESAVDSRHSICMPVGDRQGRAALSRALLAMILLSVPLLGADPPRDNSDLLNVKYYEPIQDAARKALVDAALAANPSQMDDTHPLYALRWRYLLSKYFPWIDRAVMDTAERTALKKLMLAQPQFSFDLLSAFDGNDLPEIAFKTLAWLLGSGKDRHHVQACPQLAIAIVVTHDSHYASKAEVLEKLRYLSSSRERENHKLVIDPERLSWRMLRHVVDRKASVEEARWALSRYGSSGNIKRLYNSCRLDEGSIKLGKVKRLTAVPYTLSNIRACGGWPKDVAYFVSESAKAMGIPSVRIRSHEGCSLFEHWVAYAKRVDGKWRWIFTDGGPDKTEQKKVFGPENLNVVLRHACMPEKGKTYTLSPAIPPYATGLSRGVSHLVRRRLKVSSRGVTVFAKDELYDEFTYQCDRTLQGEYVDAQTTQSVSTFALEADAAYQNADDASRKRGVLCSSMASLLCADLTKADKNTDKERLAARALEFAIQSMKDQCFDGRARKAVDLLSGSGLLSSEQEIKLFETILDSAEEHPHLRYLFGEKVLAHRNRDNYKLRWQQCRNLNATWFSSSERYLKAWASLLEGNILLEAGRVHDAVALYKAAFAVHCTDGFVAERLFDRWYTHAIENRSRRRIGRDDKRFLDEARLLWLNCMPQPPKGIGVRHTPWGKIGTAMSKAFRKIGRKKRADQILEKIVLYDTEIQNAAELI